MKGGTPGCSSTSSSSSSTGPPSLSAMPLVFRSLLFGFVTLLVVVLIIDDIAEVEEETA